LAQLRCVTAPSGTWAQTRQPADAWAGDRRISVAPGRRPELPYRPQQFLAQRERVRPCGCSRQAPCQSPVRHAWLPGRQNANALISHFRRSSNHERSAES